MSDILSAFAPHAPAVMVIAPLIAGAAAVLAPGPRLAHAVIVAGACVALVSAAALMMEVRQSGPVIYAMGGFASPYGIEMRADELGAVFALLSTGMGFLGLLYAGDSIAQDIEPHRRSFFLGALSIVLSGLIGLCITGDAFNAFVCLEISSIAAYALIASGRDRRCLAAALNYLLLGTIGATIFVLGVGFLYAATGTLNMSELSQAIPALTHSPAIRTAFILIIVGLALKAAVFPLHVWMPDAYAHAPTAASVLLSAIAGKAALYLIIRFVYTVFGGEGDSFAREALALIAPLAAAGALICSLQALGETDFRRMLAFSSAGQVGVIMLAVSAGAIAEAVFYLISHSLLKAGLFMTAGALGDRREIGAFAGLVRRRPLTALAAGVCIMSLGGIPLTGGFIAKFGIFEALLARGWIIPAAAAAIASAVTLLYCARLIDILFVRADPAVVPSARVSPLMSACALAAAMGCLYLGVAGGDVQASLTRAALALHGGAS